MTPGGRIDAEKVVVDGRKIEEAGSKSSKVDPFHLR
jgi:hypothetical protein